MRMKTTRKLLSGCFLLLLTSSVFAVDTREVVIGPQKTLVAVPPHLGHVLASPNRSFDQGIQLPGSHYGVYEWNIYEQAAEPVLWRDLSYLKGSDVVRVEKVFFDFDVAEPLDFSAVKIVLDQYPVAEGFSFLVVGHADEAGTYAYNQKLSERRALETKKELVALGYAEESIQSIGKGKTIPVSYKDQSLNRRAEIVVKGSKGMGSTPSAVRGSAVVTAPANQGKPYDESGAQLIGPDVDQQPAMRRQPINRQPSRQQQSATQKALLPSLNGDAGVDSDALFRRSNDPNMVR